MLWSASRALTNWAGSVVFANRLPRERILRTVIGLGYTRGDTAEGGTLLVSAKKAGAWLRRPNYTRLTWCLAIFETDDGADERVAPSINVCDVSVAELAIPEGLADEGHVNPEGHLFYEDVRPDVTNKFLLFDDFAGSTGEIDQNIQRSAAERKHHTLAPQRPCPAVKFKWSEPQFHWYRR